MALLLGISTRLSYLVRSQSLAVYTTPSLVRRLGAASSIVGRLNQYDLPRCYSTNDNNDNVPLDKQLDKPLDKLADTTKNLYSLSYFRDRANKLVTSAQSTKEMFVDKSNQLVTSAQSTKEMFVDKSNQLVTSAQSTKEMFVDKSNQLITSAQNVDNKKWLSNGKIFFVKMFNSSSSWYNNENYKLIKSYYEKATLLINKYHNMKKYAIVCIYSSSIIIVLCIANTPANALAATSLISLLLGSACWFYKIVPNDPKLYLGLFTIGIICGYSTFEFFL
jgi:hypothetical protein